MDGTRPTNFRTHHFNLFDKDLNIGGMAGPHHNTDRSGVLNYLKYGEKRDVLIGLHETDFSKDAHANGLEYHFIPIPDAADSPVSPDIYDAIYSVVEKATEEGKQVTIHCGAGDGRTGTALACLKLRELLEKAVKVDASILDDTPGNTTTIYATRVHEHDVPCTPFVKAAVEELRLQRTAIDESGIHSVETENEIKTLVGYEKHLRCLIKNELEAQKDVRHERTKPPPQIIKSSTASMLLLFSGTSKKARDLLENAKYAEVDDQSDDHAIVRKDASISSEKDTEGNEPAPFL